MKAITKRWRSSLKFGENFLHCNVNKTLDENFDRILYCCNRKKIVVRIK